MCRSVCAKPKCFAHLTYQFGPWLPDIDRQPAALSFLALKDETCRALWSGARHVQIVAVVARLDAAIHDPPSAGGELAGYDLHCGMMSGVKPHPDDAVALSRSAIQATLRIRACGIQAGIQDLRLAASNQFLWCGEHFCNSIGRFLRPWLLCPQTVNLKRQALKLGTWAAPDSVLSGLERLAADWQSLN